MARSLPASRTSGHHYWLGPSSDQQGDGGSDQQSSSSNPVGRDDLPFKVELWTDDRSSVEQVLAVTASGSIGYAAFYAATKEFPNRYVTLRHKNSIVSRWNAPGH
jgi:hypothetical protein